MLLESSRNGGATGNETGRRLRVLVIDDEPAIGTALKRALRREADVDLCSNARADLSRIQAEPVYDVILCDMMMPGMTGMELYEELRKSAPAIARRLIFVTGGACSPEAEAFLCRAEAPHLSKPFEVLDLQKMMAEVVAREGHAGAS